MTFDDDEVGKVRINLMIPAKLKKGIDQYCARTGYSMSELVRAAIIAHLTAGRELSVMSGEVRPPAV